MADALALESVRLDYPGRPGVLAGVQLRVAPGELVVLRGRSGSGKSSLVNVAAGLEAATSGRVLVDGQPMDVARAAGLRAAKVGLVFQHLNLLGELTVAENVELPLRLRRAPAPGRRARVAALLDAFGLDGLAARRPSTLSGGEQQRAAIARALATQPVLLLCDEPTSHLDADNARTVIEALRTAARRGAGVLVATHDDLLSGLGRQLVLRDGRVEALAAPKEP